MKSTSDGRERPEYRDFLILTRFKDSLSVYAKAMEAYNIPYTISGGSGFQESQPMRELYKLLKAVAHPHHSIAIAAVLRGRFFGIQDGALFRFKEAGGRFHIFASLPETVKDPDRSPFQDAFNRLRRYAGWAQSLPPAAALEAILEDIGFFPMTLSDTNSLVDSACAFQVLERVKAQESTALTEFSQGVELLQEMLEHGAEEALDIAAEDKNAVRLMNLHRAKGLEAPVVFLAQPRRISSNRAEQHIRRRGQVSQGYFALSRSAGYHSECIAHPKDWPIYQEEEINCLRHEEDRLLYVAGTRAMNLLIVSACSKEDKNPWAPILEGLDDSCCLDVSAPAMRAITEEIPLSARIPNTAAQADTYTAESYQAFLERKGRLFADLSLPSEALASPTGLKNTEEIFSVQRGAGGGTSYGLALHHLFEEILRSTHQKDELSAYIAAEYGLNGQ